MPIFGYKMPYIDVCRVFLSAKSKDEYTAYVEHEEVLRSSLKQCHTLAEFSKHSITMLLSDLLNPTRTNILSNKLVRDKLIGWRQMLSLDCMQENKRLCVDFLSRIESFIPCGEYGNEIRNHRHALVPIEEFIKFSVSSSTWMYRTLQEKLLLSNTFNTLRISKILG